MFFFLFVLSFFGFTQFRGVVVALVISIVYIVLKEACLILDYSSLAFNCLRVILECFRDFFLYKHTCTKKKRTLGIRNFRRNYSCKSVKTIPLIFNLNFLFITVLLLYFLPITYSQMHRTDKHSEHRSIIWPVWPNG